jgi:hypothetical protein
VSLYFYPVQKNFFLVREFVKSGARAFSLGFVYFRLRLRCSGDNFIKWGGLLGKWGNNQDFCYNYSFSEQQLNSGNYTLKRDLQFLVYRIKQDFCAKVRSDSGKLVWCLEQLLYSLNLRLRQHSLFNWWNKQNKVGNF